MAETDIKILGRLVSGTSDKILALASEIFDVLENKRQSEINAELKSKNKTLEEKIKEIEQSQSFPTIIGNESLDAITEESVTDEISIYRFKNEDTTTNPPHLKRHGFIFIQKTEQKFGKYFIGYKQDDTNDYANIIFCCEEYLGSGEWGNSASNIPERIVQGTGESTTAVMSQKAVTDALKGAGTGDFDLENLTKGRICFGVLNSPDDAPYVGSYGNTVLGFYFVTGSGTYGYGFKGLEVDTGEIAIFVNTDYNAETGWNWEKHTLITTLVNHIVLDGVELVIMSEKYAKLPSFSWTPFFNGFLEFMKETAVVTFKDSGKSVNVMVTRQNTGTSSVYSFSGCLIQRLNDGSICFGGDTIDDSAEVYGTTMYANPEQQSSEFVFLNTNSNNGIPVVEVTCDESPDYFSAKAVASAVYNSVGDNLGPVIVKIIAGESSGFFEPYVCYGIVVGGPNDAPTEHSLILDCALYNASSEYSGRKVYKPIFNIAEIGASTVTRLQLKPLKASYENDLVVNEILFSNKTTVFINELEYQENGFPQILIGSLFGAIDNLIPDSYTGAFDIIFNDTTNNATWMLTGMRQHTGTAGESEDNYETYINGPFALTETEWRSGYIQLGYDTPPSQTYIGMSARSGTQYITAYPMATSVTSIDGGNA